MPSSRGRALTPETKKLVVSVKQYFDRNKFIPMEPSAKRTADSLGIGIATVKRVMADYNRDPRLLDEPVKMRGRPAHAVGASYQEAVRAYIRSANKKGEYYYFVKLFVNAKNCIFKKDTALFYLVPTRKYNIFLKKWPTLVKSHSEFF